MYWSEAILTAAHVVNRMSSRVLRMRTPVSILSPDCFSFFLPPMAFGCLCFIHTKEVGQSKLDARAVKGVFLVILPLKRATIS